MHVPNMHTKQPEIKQYSMHVPNMPTKQPETLKLMYDNIITQKRDMEIKSPGKKHKTIMY